MAQTTQAALLNGQLVTQPIAAAIQDAMRNLTGSAVAGILGINSANFMDAPFTVVASGGMVVTAGGSGGQKVLINSSSGPRLVDSIPSQAFTVTTANSTNTRHDLICGTYAQTQVSVGPVTIGTLSGTTVTTSSVTGYNATEAITYTYVIGTASSSPADPSVPAGAVALARITVPAAATSINSGNITVLLTTAQSQILSGVAGYVDLTSAQTIAGNKTFSGVTTVGGIQFKASGTGFEGVPGIRLNPDGSIVVSPGSSSVLYLGLDCPSLVAVGFGPGVTWGTITAVGYTSPDASATFGTSVNLTNGHVHAGASSIGFASVGDGVFERNGPSGAIFLGNSGNGYLYFDGANYNLGNGPSAGANLTVNGTVLGTGGFSIPNSGTATAIALSFGNAAGSGGLTSIGAAGAPINGITPSILNIGNVGVAQLLTMDNSGNIGIAGGLNATGGTIYGSFTVNGPVGVTSLASSGNISFGTGGVGGTLYASNGQLSITGAISTPQSINAGTACVVAGVQLPISFASDGSLALTNSGGTLTATIASVASSKIVYGSANTASSSSVLSGIMYFRKRFNYGTIPSAGVVEPSTDNNFAPISSGLGSFTHASPNGGNQVIQMEFAIRVNGGSAQTISGSFLTNATSYYVFLDHTIKTSSTTTSLLTQNWSVTIPADNNYHILILQFVNNGQIFVDHNAWSNIANASGSIDSSRFAYVGPSGNSSTYYAASSTQP